MDGDTTHSMRAQIDAIDARGRRNAERMDRLEEGLKENTALTREMYDYLVTARTGTRMIKGAAALASGIAALWAAFLWIRDHM